MSAARGLLRSRCRHVPWWDARRRRSSWHRCLLQRQPEMFELPTRIVTVHNERPRTGYREAAPDSLSKLVHGYGLDWRLLDGRYEGLPPHGTDFDALCPARGPASGRGRRLACSLHAPSTQQRGAVGWVGGTRVDPASPGWPAASDAELRDHSRAHSGSGRPRATPNPVWYRNRRRAWSIEREGLADRPYGRIVDRGSCSHSPECAGSALHTRGVV